MKRPSFQFYPADWRGNANLRRCSEAARGAWMDLLCTLHDSDEYGVVHWPLAELARAAGVALRLVKELVEKCVLKGADRGAVKFVHTPRHAGKGLEPVTLLDVAEGPCWFSSRMVKDEWRRSVSGGGTRFVSDNQPSPDKTPSREPRGSPSRRQGDDLGDGASSSTSSSSTKKKKDISRAARFDDFWIVCPKKVGKGAAEKAFSKASGDAEPDILITAMRRYAETQTGKDPTFTAHPATWLNQKRWLDETGPPAGSGATIHVLSPEIRAAEQENLKKMGII